MMGPSMCQPGGGGKGRCIFCAGEEDRSDPERLIEGWLDRRAYKAIDCAGMARVDFFVERGTNRVLANEANTLPGFTPISMYPKLWEASGRTYPDLLARLIDLAVERFESERRRQIRRA